MQSLKRKHAKALRRIRKEALIMDRARGRKNYWQNVKKNLEVRLDLIKHGQVEMPF